MTRKCSVMPWMTEQAYENHIFQYWMHQHFSAPVAEVRQATDDPLVHAVIDWLTLPTDGKDTDNGKTEDDQA